MCGWWTGSAKSVQSAGAKKVEGPSEGADEPIRSVIARYSALPGVLAWKMPGAGGGGYLALVCRDRASFPEDAIPLTIRRQKK